MSIGTKLRLPLLLLLHQQLHHHLLVHLLLLDRRLQRLEVRTDERGLGGVVLEGFCPGLMADGADIDGAGRGKKEGRSVSIEPEDKIWGTKMAKGVKYRV